MKKLAIVKSVNSTLRFPRSKVLEFYRAHDDWHRTGQRLGQAFYDFLELESWPLSPADRTIVELLKVEPSSDAARKVIISCTDWNQ